MRRVCERYPTYGYRRVASMLRREGLRVNHKRVCRLMRELGLSQPRIRTQRVGSSQRKVAGGATGPNQVWQMDLTRIWVARFGWLNLVAIIDVWDRCVVAHLVALRARAAEWVATLDQAVMARFPQGIREAASGLCLQVDNGCQPTSGAFVAAARTLGIELAYTNIQAPNRNAYIERFFRTLKEEEVWLNIYATPDEARLSVGNYVRFYNQERPHSALGYRSPASFPRTQLIAA